MRNHVIRIMLAIPLLFLSLVVGSTAALATTDSELVERLDLDGDGEIGIKEAVASPSLLAVFGKIDTDCSGTLSLPELAYYAQQVVSQAQAQQVEY
jgi:hypothetical protein